MGAMALIRWSLLFLAACAGSPPPAEPEPVPEPDPVLADVEADRILAAKYAEIARRELRRFESRQVTVDPA